MRRALLLLGLVLSLQQAASAWTFQPQARLSVNDLIRLIGGSMYIVDMGSISVAADNGELFILSREFSKRQLHWFLVDARKRKLLRHGSCPFTGFSELAVSGSADRAYVVSMYPVRLYSLELTSGKWTEAYQNPKSGGLAVTAAAPLAFVSGSIACSVMDERDAEAFITGTFVVTMLPLQKLVSLATLRSFGISTALKNRVADYIKARVDDVRFGDARSLVYVFKTVNDRTKQFVEHLMCFEAPDKATVIDSAEGELFPLDYDATSKRVLFRRSTKASGVEVVLDDAGKKTVLLKAKALSGAFFGGDLVAVTAVENESFLLYAGKRGEPLTRAATFPQAYGATFLRAVPEVVLINHLGVQVCRAVP